MEMYFSGKSKCKHVFFFLENSRSEYFWAARVHLLFAEDDMPFVSGSYVTEVIEKSGFFFFFFFFFFFQKANKNGSDDFNLEVTEK